MGTNCKHNMIISPVEVRFGIPAISPDNWSDSLRIVRSRTAHNQNFYWNAIIALGWNIRHPHSKICYNYAARYLGSHSRLHLVAYCFDTSLTSLNPWPWSVQNNMLLRRSEESYPSRTVSFKQDPSHMKWNWCDRSVPSLCPHRHQCAANEHIQQAPSLLRSGLPPASKHLHFPFCSFRVVNKFPASRTQQSRHGLSISCKEEGSRISWAGVLEVVETIFRKKAVTGQYLSTITFRKTKLIGIPFPQLESNGRPE